MSSSASTTTSIPTKTVAFPSSLASKIIWTPVLDDDDTTPTPADDASTPADATAADSPASANNTPIPKFTFSEDIISEVQAHIAHGLSPAVQMGIVKVHNLRLDDKKDKRIKEPLITVLYPRDGCHGIIDAAIRATAQDQEADVLVIDSLELALGELGVYGKDIIDAVAALYKEPVIPDEEESKDDSKEDTKTEDTKTEDTEMTSEKESSGESTEKDASDSASESSSESFEVVSEDKAKSSKETTGEVSAEAKAESSEKTADEVKEETKDGEKKDEENKDGEKKGEEKPELTDKEKEELEKRKQERIEKEKTRLDRQLQDIFDALVDLPPPSGKEATKTRIIYWRDFGNIGKGSNPIMLRLFRGMHARRTAKFTKDSKSRDLIQPTILVLGDSKWISSERYSSQSPRAAFTRGGSALDKFLPYVGTDVITLSNDTFTTELPPPSTGFFLRSLVPNDIDNDPFDTTYATTFSGKFELSDFDISGSTLSIFPEGSDKKEFRKVEERLLGDRKKEVANAWVKVALAQCGGSVAEDVDILGTIGDDKDVEAILLEEEKKHAEKEAKRRADSLDSDGEDDDEDKKKKKEEEEKDKQKKDHICKGSRLLDQLVKHTSAPLPVSLERVATAAFGLTASEGATTEVSPASFTKAYMTVNKNAKAKSSWWKKNKMPKGYYESDSEDSDKEDEKDKKKDKKEVDPIVKKVKAADDLSKYESRLLSSIVDVGELDTSFDDVCISESTVDTLRTIVSLPLLFPSAFKSGVLAKEAIGGVLLYGPPGTGKTLVCRAVARECGARMLAIKPSDVMDCYVGESEKLVNAIFSLAYRLAPCLVFIDELDSLFRKRQNDDKKWTRDILAEFLQCMDGLRSAKKNKEAGVIVIGATNRPYDIDDAVLRRLPSRMIVDVPNEEEREKIMQLHLRGEALEEGLTLTDIARKTVHYSGSDLKNLCVSAAMASVKEAIGTFSWKVRKPKPEKKKDEVKKDGEKKDEKDEDKKDEEKKDEEKKDKEKKDEEKKDEKKDEETLETEEAKERISKRTVKMSHFLQAMNDVPASSAAGSHSELRRWHEQFGKKSPTSTGSKPSYGAGASGTSSSSPSVAGRYGSYTGGGAGSTPRYGGYGSSESGATPRFGAGSGDSTSTTTPRYGSYGAGSTGDSASTTTPRYGSYGAGSPGDSASNTTPRYGSYGAGSTGDSASTTTPRYGSSASTPRYGAVAPSGDSTAPQPGTGAAVDSATPRYGVGATGDSIASRYGSGGFSASSYLNGKTGSAGAGYTPGAGLGRYGAGGYTYGAKSAVEEEPSATIEQVVEPDSEQVQEDLDSEESETKP